MDIKSKKDNDISEVESSNIFDDFVENSNLLEEVDKIKKDRSKGVFYYINKIGAFFQTIFWLFSFIVGIIYIYIYIQNNENINNNSFLVPVCNIFLADINVGNNTCSSLLYMKNNIDKQLNLIKLNQFNNILFVLEKLYEIENFTKTKDIIFLSDKSNSKLKVLDILEEFDDLKISFDKIDKEKIKCSGLSIDGKKEILTLSCSAYSAGYEKNIKGFDGTSKTPLKGTSISIANSFLNYITKQSDVFSIVNRQKKFISTKVVLQNTDFTQKTDFSLQLKYNIK